MKRFVAMLFTAADISTAAAHAATAAAVKHVVLLHASFADGSCSRAVAEILEKDGYHVAVVQHPETSLADDVSAVKRVLALQDGPTVLVGHSYGGVVVTEAGSDAKVA